MAGIAKQGNQGLKAAWYTRVHRNTEAGLRHGFRSGLEDKNARFLEGLGEPVLFETIHIKYVIPESRHTYTPDFELRNGILIETKGKFEPKDRAKHLLVRAQYPDLDIRIVFQRPSDPINQGSKTSYAEWATARGIQWATGLIPAAWIKEDGPARKPSEVLSSPPLFRVLDRSR